ncbi:MAG: hypothetical protein CSB46_09795, partial [Micrococcales bacterium]
MRQHQLPFVISARTGPIQEGTPMAEPTPTAEPTEKDARDLQAYYDGMKQERKRLIVPLVSIILFLYFFQQVLTNFTPAMDGFITENMTIAFAYTIAMFFAIIAVTMIYSSRMNKIESQLTPPNLEEIAARRRRPGPQARRRRRRRAGSGQPRHEGRVMKTLAAVLFVIFIGATLGITWWASKRNKSVSSHLVAEGRISGRN